MKKENSFALCCVGFLLLFGAACQSSELAQTGDNKPEANVNSSAGSGDSAADGAKKPQEKKGIISASEKADYVATAEDLWKEHAADREKKQEKNQDKYKGKIVEISGRFLQADLDKTVNGEYSTRLSAGAGLFDWVNCNVEEAHKEDFAKLKKDQKVKLKGMGDDFWLAGPTFKHCILLEAN